ncbi:MAG: hypothetical protein C5B54_07270 [Acidobacteria bacterium]|nr:MAG: hypothetical protein C5B54_07270 [Acidobacteriota bacterium]
MSNPAFQASPRVFQDRSFQSAIPLVARGLTVRPVFFTSLLYQLHFIQAQDGAVDAPTFAAPEIIGEVTALPAANALTLLPQIARPSGETVHRLIPRDLFLVEPSFSSVWFIQFYQLFANAFNLLRPVFARPQARRALLLGARPITLQLDVATSGPIIALDYTLTAETLSLAPLTFGFPGPLTTEPRAVRGWPPTYITQTRAAMDILNGFLNLVLRSVPSTATGEAAPLLRLVAAMRANLRGVIVGNRLGTELQAIMLAAEAAGATYAGMEAARQYLMGFEASDMVFIQVVMRGALVMTLATQCKILARMRFITQREAQNATVAIVQAFDAAKAMGIDQVDALVYRTLNTLAGAITAHLAATGLKLPRYVSYTIDMPMPSLYMAQRIYGDGSRHEEIEMENRIVHPAFCPRELRVLSDAGMWEPRYPMPERALPGLRQPGTIYGPAELPFPVITR